MKNLLIAAIAVAVAAPAAALTLTNSNGGDGFVTPGPAPYAFTLFGANNGAPNNLAEYTGVATAAATFNVAYSYHTDDVDGSAFDRAGYEVNGVLFQVSPANSPTNFTQTGTISFTVAAGDTYGYYVDSTDGVLGRGSISIGTVPEPASWALMIAGFGLIGGVARSRRAVAA